ncbi:MAG: type IX secretion system membrane protein PorP/SprF [Thermonemataceae bacterium]|nr:type IX secretion system membrane protein PorP/SprF [Thermonemataceae bacterium]
MKHQIHILFRIFLCSLIGYTYSFGQGIPNTPFVLHNYNNYFLNNPAGAGLPPLYGIPEDPLFFLTHNRQQIGSFENTPVYSSASFNKYIYRHFINEEGQKDEELTKNAWGGNLYNFSRSIWQTNGFWLSYAREINLPPAIFGIPLPVHNLRLGLSAGAEANSLSVDGDVLLNDPTIANLVDNKIKPTGQFGAMYIVGGTNGATWELGAALPRLLKSSDTDKTIEGFYPISNWLLSISRQFTSPKVPNFYLKPLIIWRAYENKTNALEVNTMLNYYNTGDSMKYHHHWVGATWVKDYGLAVLAGTKFYKGKFGVSYAYKFNGQKLGFNTNPVHEIQLIYNLRKLSKINAILQKDVPPVVQDTTIYDDEIVMDSVLVEDTLILVKEDTNATERMVNPDTLTDEEKRIIKYKNYRSYVVVGSFKVKANAQRKLRELQIRFKIKGRVRFNPNNGFYNVYILETDSFEEALQMDKKAQDEMNIPDAWILLVPKAPPPDK